MKPINYRIVWTQEYLNWYNYVDTMAEAMVESSDMKEAREVLARIMAK
jgi:hypothetical protein